MPRINSTKAVIFDPPVPSEPATANDADALLVAGKAVIEVVLQRVGEPSAFDLARGKGPHLTLTI
jgi:hypothetical protein